MQGLVMEMHECISISIFQEKGKISAKIKAFEKSKLKVILWKIIMFIVSFKY